MIIIIAIKGLEKHQIMVLGPQAVFMSRKNVHTCNWPDMLSSRTKISVDEFRYNFELAGRGVVLPAET
jgi:hypothetical protein